MKVRVHILVSGKVQGVFFRSETKKEADRLDVKGWVRNLSDGRVEALLEGEGKVIEKVIDFFREGPRYAKVEHLEVDWEDYRREFEDFRIRPTL